MRPRRSPSLLALWACVAMIVAAHLYYPKWTFSHSEATLSYDVSGYYFYLPATFIYQDLRRVAFQDSILREYRPTYTPYQTFEHPSGNRVMKYSLGLAVMYSPFFAIGHAVALASESYPADGFSRPYQLAISFWALLVAVLGLILLRRLLRYYFDDRAVALTLLVLVFGTNYLNYSAIDGAMTHNFLFTLYAGLLLLSRRFQLRAGAGRSVVSTALAIGFLVGLMALTRPTEIIAAVIPLLWGMPLTGRGVSDRWSLIVGRLPALGLSAVACLAVGSLQLLYWKYVSGDWIVYSYEDQGFDWFAPHLQKGLFSYRRGWLTYSPLMWLALLGFLALWRRRGLFTATAVHATLFIYITFAWSVWWYGGSLGQRAMVQAYPVLAIAMTAGFSWVLGRGRSVWRYGLCGLILVGIAHNLWLTHHAHRGRRLDEDGVTKRYYWSLFTTLEDGPRQRFLLDNSDGHPGTFAEVDTLRILNFDGEDGRNCDLPPIAGAASFCLDKGAVSTPELWQNVSLARRQWIIAEADFVSTARRGSKHNYAQFVIRFYREGQKIRERFIRVHRRLNDEPRARIRMGARAPWNGADAYSVLIWNGGDEQPALLVDNIVITTPTEN